MKLIHVTQITDKELEALTARVYGRGYFADAEEIGGDDSGGYIMCYVTPEKVPGYAEKELMEFFMNPDSPHPKYMAQDVLNMLCRDGHIRRGKYLLEGIWG